MKSVNLNELAASVGIGIGRNKPGIYRWTVMIDGRPADHEFAGTHHEFAKFIRQKVAGIRASVDLRLAAPR
jgi:hypothetical protein